MARPPMGAGMAAGAAPTADPMADPMAEPAGEGQTEDPSEGSTEESISIVITEHQGPDGPSYSVYDHMPSDSDQDAGDGALVTTPDLGEAMNAVYSKLKGTGDSEAKSQAESGYASGDD